MTTDVTIIRLFCEVWGYKFFLTREALDFQALLDDDFSGVYCIQAQGRITPNISSSTGFLSSKTYTGRLYFGIPSNIDGVLDGDKYDNFVYNIDSLDIIGQINSYFCSEAKFSVKNMQPFYNLFAINYDGIAIDYEIEVYDFGALTEAEKRFFIENGRTI